LGGRFLDQNARELPFGGGELHRLQKIDLRKLNPKARNCNWIIACDVENPLLGKQGTAHTYAKQKGASQKDIEKLEKGGVRFAEIVKKQFEIDLGPVKGGGAAGGVGAGLFGLLGARIENGFELLAELSGLKNHLTNMDLILTGEGSFDQQSLFGKLPIQVAKLANKEEIQTLIVAGNAKLEKLKDMPYCKILNCTPDGIPINEALKNAESNLKNTLVKELKNLKMQNK
jgi:glycerate kinase